MIDFQYVIGWCLDEAKVSARPLVQNVSYVQHFVKNTTRSFILNVQITLAEYWFHAATDRHHLQEAHSHT